MRTFIYIDGYNFYYRCVKNTPYKWLNLDTFCKHLLPQSQIDRINYYTALAKPLPTDPDVGKRQNAYLRALRTLPNFNITYGHYKSHPVNLPIYESVMKGEIPPRFATVLKSEEKGSDVNLASELVYDACKGRFDSAVVFSNDSDLTNPIKIVTERLKIPIYVYLKDNAMTSKQLRKVATNIYYFRNKDLKAHQFPTSILDHESRPIEKPLSW